MFSKIEQLAIVDWKSIFYSPIIINSILITYLLLAKWQYASVGVSYVLIFNDSVRLRVSMCI